MNQSLRDVLHTIVDALVFHDDAARAALHAAVDEALEDAPRSAEQSPWLT